MKHPLSNYLAPAFLSAATKPEAKSKRKKRPSPISIRVTVEERAELQAMAGRAPVGAYIKECVFKGHTPRKARHSNPVDDFDTLARVLSALGRSDVFRNLDVLAAQAEAGTLDLSDGHIQTVLAACACVTSMRADLIRALGLVAD